MAENTNPKIVTFREVRINNPAVFEPQLYLGNLSYNVQLLLPKGGTEHKKAVAGMLAAAKETWQDKAEKKLQTFTGATQNCLTDGDLKDYEPLEGHMTLRARIAVGGKRQRVVKPLVVDRYRDENGKLQVLTAADGKIYSGVIVNCGVEFWGQEDRDNPGIRCSLINMQFVKHAPAFGGGVQISEVGLDDLGYDGDDDINEDDDLA